MKFRKNSALEKSMYKNSYKYLLIFTFSIISLVSLFSQDSDKIETWKFDLQILLGLYEEEVDGIMDKETFDALKLFANEYQLLDVVLRGEYDDLGYWGFQQYIMKYHQYWIRELKNNKIIDDVINKEYLKQADQTLYSFERAIENAQLEVERLIHAKSKAKRIAEEKQKIKDWKKEKNEADRIISALGKAIVTAEEEAGKWGLERIRAIRLAEEREQLERLEERKLEAVLLTSDLEDVIRIAKNEISRLADSNNELKSFIQTSADTKSVAESLKAELKEARLDLDSLAIKKDSLESKLKYIESKIGAELLHEYESSQLLEVKDTPGSEKKKWYQKLWPFSKK